MSSTVTKASGSISLMLCRTALTLRRFTLQFKTETVPSFPRPEISVTACPASRIASAIALPRRELMMRMWLKPTAKRSSIIMPTTLPVANPPAYPMRLKRLSRLLSTLVMAITHNADWKNPKIQANGLRPRITKRTRIVSSDISVTRRKNITSGMKAGWIARMSSIDFIRSSLYCLELGSAGKYISLTYSFTMRRMLKLGASV